MDDCIECKYGLRDVGLYAVCLSTRGAECMQSLYMAETVSSHFLLLAIASDVEVPSALARFYSSISVGWLSPSITCFGSMKDCVIKLE